MAHSSITARAGSLTNKKYHIKMTVTNERDVVRTGKRNALLPIRISFWPSNHPCRGKASGRSPSFLRLQGIAKETSSYLSDIGTKLQKERLGFQNTTAKARQQGLPRSPTSVYPVPHSWSRQTVFGRQTTEVMTGTRGRDG